MTYAPVSFSRIWPTQTSQFEAVCALLLSRDDNAHPLQRESLQAARAIVVAQNSVGEVIACAVIKPGSGAVAELGYLMVNPLWRRQGIARQLTSLRIDIARQLGVQLLYATVRAENQASRANLLQNGFVFWGNYLSIRGTGNVIGWYYRPLVAGLACDAIMLDIVGTRTRLP